MTKITSTERAWHVQQTNANNAIEGLLPDHSDREIQARYIAGTASLPDLLDNAKAFVAGRFKPSAKPF